MLSLLLLNLTESSAMVLERFEKRIVGKRCATLPKEEKASFVFSRVSPSKVKCDIVVEQMYGIYLYKHCV